MTELEQKQIIFSRYLGLLLQQFPDLCFQLGEVWRSPETCALYAREGRGIANSCHALRLAIDFNIWIDGELSNTKREYQPVADYWKQLPTLYPAEILVRTCWGGDFIQRPDVYHFSIEHHGAQ